tara:strand:- start:51 stop:161 length:111 start_codon:yes stop_codon:yes gene_type:complete
MKLKIIHFQEVKKVLGLWGLLGAQHLNANLLKASCF